MKSLTESELKPGEHAGLSYRGWRVCWWWKVLFLLCWFLMCWFLKNQIPYFIECAVYEWQGLRFALVVGSALLIAYLWAMTIYRCRCELRIRDGRVICTSYARFRTQTSEIPLEGQTFAGLTDDEMGITISTNCGSESERVNLLLDGFSSSFCVWASAWLNIQLGRGEMNH